jgi:TetR/AcrR family transcriptional regulator, cholesterol catabolism regulator
MGQGSDVPDPTIGPDPASVAVELAGAEVASVDVAGGARGDQLTKSQAARRSRVIRAAIELAATGGYDAVQMRDVAAHGQVALGTIYRYFTSKDHLLAAAQVEWVTDLERRVSQRPPRGDTTANRMVEILRRATRAMEREPALTAALVTAMSSPDPGVADCRREMGVAMGRIQSLAFPEEFDAVIERRIIDAIEFIWFSSLLAWANGWVGISDAGEHLASAAHLLLDQYD